MWVARGIRMDSLGISVSGMRAASLRLDAVASSVARRPVDDATVGDLVEARSAALGFDANARGLQATDQTIGFLLDVMA